MFPALIVWVPLLTVDNSTLSQMTDFRLFQTKRVCRRVLNLMKMGRSSPKG